jgi:formate dehydrogenase major subunit
VRNSGREKTTAFVYSVGWTQHSVGVQYIRTAAIIQLLLGNIGRPGGGILALRGHASIQGSTDIPTLYDLLPGYLPMPHAGTQKLADYIKDNHSSTHWWSEFPKYIVSLLKAWFGPAATQDNDFCFNWLPKLTGIHSHMVTAADMADGRVPGYFVMGENPAGGSAHAGLHRRGLRKLKWLVVRDFQPTETAEFWRVSPEHERNEVRAEDIGTEVFFFPAAAHTEKDGSFTNTQRLLQWHHKAVEPEGDARSELHFMYHLGKRLRERYATSLQERDRPLQRLTWEYPTHGAHEEPSAEAVLAEINGYTIADGEPVDGFKQLAADGSTACGCWIYSGAYKDGVNQPARRKAAREQNYVAGEWGWAWPANRRLLYNRASADPEGKPWSEKKRYVWWDEAKQRLDRPRRARLHRRSAALLSAVAPAPKGSMPSAGSIPSSCSRTAKAGCSRRRARSTGRCRRTTSRRSRSFAICSIASSATPRATSFAAATIVITAPIADDRFPFVLTTFRLTEHHTTGAMSRWLPWLAELQPEMFCEVSPELAAARGLRNGGWATLSTFRAQIECRVLVTRRMRSLTVDGRRIHQVAPALSLGRGRPRARRRRQRAVRVRRRSQRRHHGDQGADLRRARPAGARAATRRRTCGGSWPKRRGCGSPKARARRDDDRGQGPPAAAPSQVEPAMSEMERM